MITPTQRGILRTRLQKAISSAKEMRASQNALRRVTIDIWGEDFSDVNADDIIDSVEHGMDMSVDEFIESMDRNIKG
jgi:hypothetical protein